MRRRAPSPGRPPASRSSEPSDRSPPWWSAWWERPSIETKRLRGFFRTRAYRQSRGSARGEPWLLPLRRQADVQRHGFAAARLDFGREPAIPALLDFHAMRPFGNLHEEPFLA